MKWLVVVERGAAAGGLVGLLHAADASPAPGAEWIDLGPDEMTIEVDGPADLPARLDSARGVREVYPSSEPTLYR
jgi:hypothetical protein